MSDWVLSLVPTQLQRLLARPATREWLRRFRVIPVGGGPLWPDLANAAAAARLPIAISYGMTETAAMVTALRPEEFLLGTRSCGAPLPHARVAITAEGVVRVAGESVFRGYWPEWCAARAFETEDLGRIDERGHLHVLGRRDALIISGGRKIAAAEVEAALRASGEFPDVAVVGMPDAEWGEVVIACYPAGEGRAPDLARAIASLAPHQRPKRFVPVADWPRSAQGKIDCAVLREVVRGVRS
jgi:O-succinylbenzoic acid--CoA ligase